MPAKSKSQQRFFGMVRAAQKGELENPSSEVADVADDISVKDAKKFAKTKHKGLPEKKAVKEELTGDMKTDLEKYRVPRGPGGNPKRIGDKVRSMKSSQPLGQLKVKYGADKVREYYKKNKAVGEQVQIEEKKGRHPRDQKELDRAQAYIKKNPNFGKKEVKEEASYKDFVKKAQDASSRVKKAKQAERDSNAKSAYRDKVTKGVRFYDKKGKGHIRDGKKVYS